MDILCEHCGTDKELILFASIENNPDIDYYLYCAKCKGRTYQEDISGYESQVTVLNPQLSGIKNNKKLYDIYLKTNMWNKKRKKVLKRANYTCEGCGNSDRSLQIHHTTYENVYNEFLFELLALCKHCHKMIHDNQRYK